MTVSDLAGWIGPAATMIAALMTAANLGARVTGWGFVVFAIGSVAWSIVAIGSGQQNLLWTNGFLSLVNLLGIWRWLGRQARYDDGSKAASVHSARAEVPTLFSVGSIVGAPLRGKGGVTLGTVVDAMTRCADSTLAYVVVSEGGVAGVGERLRALRPEDLHFSADGPRCDLDAAALAQRPELRQGEWPIDLPHLETPHAAR
ncbi:PRC-barrel domain containing protein [Sphingomonas sp. RB3P16]|uniref:PRC-barrel domain containing protein n=1 Tax=Parasphingomonas frigoris TaxID=3096163 RepID=UPI002FC71B9B